MVLAGLIAFVLVGGEAVIGCGWIPFDLSSSSDLFASSFGGIILAILIWTPFYLVVVRPVLFFFCLNSL